MLNVGSVSPLAAIRDVSCDFFLHYERVIAGAPARCSTFFFLTVIVLALAGG